MTVIARQEIPRLILAIAICQFAGALGSVFTSSSVSTWYPTLIKPSFTPPGSVIGGVWIMLFTLMGISLFLVWREGKGDADRNIALGVFAAQLVVNVLLVLGLLRTAVAPGRNCGNSYPLASYIAGNRKVLAHLQECCMALGALHSLGELCSISQLHYLAIEFLETLLFSTDSNIWFID